MIATLISAACQTIPNLRWYREIPFVDCPEAVYIESVTRKTGILRCEEYAKVRPFMLMLDPDGVREIKLNWKKQCRNDGDSCNVQLESFSEGIEALDQIVEDAFQLTHP